MFTFYTILRQVPESIPYVPGDGIMYPELEIEINHPVKTASTVSYWEGLTGTGSSQIERCACGMERNSGPRLVKFYCTSISGVESWNHAWLMIDDHRDRARTQIILIPRVHPQTIFSTVRRRSQY